MLATPPDGILHHEDIVVGVPFVHGAKRVEKAEIIAFARAFDPQAMHIDEAAAKATIVAGLCAAGMHSCAMMMRLLCDGLLLRSASLGSPGLDEVKWLKPVRPGDTLSVKVICTEKRDLASRADVGLTRMTFDLLNQHGEAVLATASSQLFRRRHRAAPAGDAKPSPRAKPPVASLWDLPATPVSGPASRFFEDRQIGEVADIGSHTFDAEAIKAFARQFDPQPFHLDEAAGKRSLFGGLAASGWHTAAHFIRLIVAERQAGEAAARAAGLAVAAYGPSPGFRNLGWLKPVLAGDTLSFRSRIAGKIDLKSRPDRGLLVADHQGRNQRGEIAFLYTSQIFVERRQRRVATV